MVGKLLWWPPSPAPGSHALAPLEWGQACEDDGEITIVIRLHL